MLILEHFRNHMHQAIYVRLLDHVEFYIIVHDDDVQRNYEHNLRHGNDSMLYFQTKNRLKIKFSIEKKSSYTIMMIHRWFINCK
jgi:hypothetical protein